MREEYHSQIAVKQISAQVLAAAGVAPAAGVAMKETQACKFVMDIGAEGATTLSATEKAEFILEESDDDSTYVAVTSADKVIGQTPDSSGIIVTVDAAADAAQVYEAAYIGDKNFARVRAAVTTASTIVLPVSVVAQTGHLNRSRA